MCHARRSIGGEIHPKQVKRTLVALIKRGFVHFEGNNCWQAVQGGR